ncbi:1010_t:CDS:1, partial [Entrophospora sp. SA101]
MDHINNLQLLIEENSYYVAENNNDVDDNLDTNIIDDGIDIETGNDSFATKIKLLSKVLYKQQRKFKKGIESDPSKFSDMIEQ